MISRFEVKNLFGVFNHNIPLTENNGITLILGENGLGKTIILKLVKAFFDGNFHEINEVVFDEFIISFLDGSSLKITRSVKENDYQLVFEYDQAKKKKTHAYTFISFHKGAKRRRYSSIEEQMLYERRMQDKYYYSKTSREFYSSRDSELDYLIERYIPVRLERVGADKWIEYNTNIIYSSKEIISKFSGALPKDIVERFGGGIPEWLTELTFRTKVKLIETQRLLVQADEGKYRPSVTNYSNQLVETIKNKRSEATDLGSNLDRTYPTRVINEIANSNNTTSNYITNSFVALQDKRALLNNVGLLDTEVDNLQPNINQFSEKILKEVLFVYIEDSNKKLSIYDDLSKRIKLLLDIINKRFTYKKLSIEKNKGFVFTSTINGKEIPLSGLSSGEQHELVLYFELLFNTSENSLLLIDEPEISLHISWQKQFIKDLSSVTTLNNLSVIIATHSPDIIGNHWPLTVQLKGIN